MSDQDENFYHRADEYIQLANTQIKTGNPGRVSASMLFAVSRFNTWISARGFNNAVDMKSAKTERVDNFVKLYKEMLEENYDDYVDHFEDYIPK
jgi:hypothetical protein